MYSSVITLANSIIGVSILAMPYCYRQCGIILATLMIILSGTIVKLACHLLIKSAIMARRRNIENLAFHTHGPVGKLLVELGIIGYLIGTSIAFFVVMGDLGPPLIASLAGVEATYNLRMIILTGLGLFVALPLSLLRNIESLQIICASSILFYLTVVFRVVLEAAPALTSTHWLEGVSLWRPAGMLQCFPIFSMALACQANVFEVYASLPDPSPQKMNAVVKGAVNLCSGIYITIGFFGYIAFYTQDFGGNILTSFTPTTRFVDFLKLGFVISVAVSFPLVVFPCRTSIHSLIFRKTYQGIGSTELVTDYIPPARFNLITLCVILITLSIGIIIPDIELVLGIVGSTMGSSICVIFPAVAFLKLTSKNTTERLAAQGVLVIGVITLILGTYVNLVEHSSAPAQEYQRFGPPKPVYVPPPDAPPPQQPVDLSDTGKSIEAQGESVIKKISESQEKAKSIDKVQEDKSLESKDIVKEEIRQEPAVPQEPETLQRPDSPVDKDDKSNLTKTKIESKEAKDKEVKEVKDIKETKDEDKVEQPGEDKKVEEIKDKDKKDAADVETLLKEMAEYKKDQERVLNEQKKILSELKQHQLHDVAKEQQGQIQQQTNLTAANIAAPVPSAINAAASRHAALVASKQADSLAAPAQAVNPVAAPQSLNSAAVPQDVNPEAAPLAVNSGAVPLAANPAVASDSLVPAADEAANLAPAQVVNPAAVEAPAGSPVAAPSGNPAASPGGNPAVVPAGNPAAVDNLQYAPALASNFGQGQAAPQANGNNQAAALPLNNGAQMNNNQQFASAQIPQQVGGQQFVNQPALNGHQGLASVGGQNGLAGNQAVPGANQFVNQPAQGGPNGQIGNQAPVGVQAAGIQTGNQVFQGGQFGQMAPNAVPGIQNGQASNGVPLAGQAGYQAQAGGMVGHSAIHQIPNAHVKLRNLQPDSYSANNQQQHRNLNPSHMNNQNVINNKVVGIQQQNVNQDNFQQQRQYAVNNLQQQVNGRLPGGGDLGPGQSRDRRGALCENDPNCEAKFDRNPLQDSPLNQDILRLQYIGGKRNLQEERSSQNLDGRSSHNLGNQSVKDIFQV